MDGVHVHVGASRVPVAGSASGAIVTQLPGNALAVTAGADDLVPADQSVFVLTSGNFTVVPTGGQTAITFTSYPANTYLPFRCKKVTAATGTCLGTWG